MRLRHAGLLAAVVTAATCLVPAVSASAAGCAPTGDIGRTWTGLGGTASQLGPCTTGEYPVAKGGTAQHFVGGSVYRSPATGAHALYGALRDSYASRGWENSALGFPTHDEFGPLSGGGYGQHFQGGSIYWSGATGAHAVRGAIRDEWASKGWETSTLGYPVAEEQHLTIEGGYAQHFQGGSVYWTPGLGATVVQGAVRDAWAATGFEWGKLGYPVADERAVAGGTRTDFQFGFVTRDAATSRTSVTYTSDIGPWVRPASYNPAVPSCRTIDPGYNGQRVKLVQRRLGIAGSEPEWNKGVTTAAVKDFQRAQRLPVTGAVDRATWDRMGIRADFCQDGWQQPVQVAPNATARQRTEKMVEVAHRYLGDEYVWGGTGPERLGVDCSGLVLQAMLAAGLSPQPVNVALHPLADYRTSQALYDHQGLRHVPLAQVQRGDLVFYTSDSTRRIVHVALALGGGKMIEAPNQKAPVRIVDITTKRGAETIAPLVVRPFS